MLAALVLAALLVIVAVGVAGVLVMVGVPEIVTDWATVGTEAATGMAWTNTMVFPAVVAVVITKRWYRAMTGVVQIPVTASVVATPPDCETRDVFTKLIPSLE
jgi:uncharacterized paraquat-inducible protein A